MRTDEAQLPTDLDRDAASGIFAQTLGLADVDSTVVHVGNQQFLKFRVGRKAPIYEQALRETLKRLPQENAYRGLLGLDIESPLRFPDSVEAEVLRGVLARSTRNISTQQASSQSIGAQYVPFQNNEETLVIQPATHLIMGRRGVGKSTLILKAIELLRRSSKLCVVLDMEPYGHRSDNLLLVDLLSDLAEIIAKSAVGPLENAGYQATGLQRFAADLLDGKIAIERASATLRRLISALTEAADTDLFLFLDDFHLVDLQQQPRVAQTIHGATKGARSWLKIAGLHSFMRAYDPATRMGLQVPGDAQIISLDLTLVDPAAAEEHLRKILSRFLENVGITDTRAVIAEQAFHRLVWANAGVPRDFLQMFGSAIEHSARVGRSKVELSDVNLAIGEFGQQKMGDMEQDAQNSDNQLKLAIEFLESYCLDKKKTSAFLIRGGSTEEHSCIQRLSDLRLVHLLHQTITPHKAGQRYEAYMLDYSLFTGFRRRPGVNLVLPADGKQFKAAELRKLPILPGGFLKSRAAKNQEI